MIAGRDRSVHLNRVLLLGSGQDADHDAGELGGRGQEIEATDGPGGDFDAPSRGQVAGVSRHGCVSRGAPQARLLYEWRRGGRREGSATTRCGSAVTHRRQPVSVGERHRRAPCGQSPTTPYAARRRKPAAPRRPTAPLSAAVRRQATIKDHKVSGGEK